MAVRCRHVVASHCAMPGLCSHLSCFDPLLPHLDQDQSWWAQWFWSHTAMGPGPCSSVAVLLQNESEEQLPTRVPIHVHVSMGLAKPQAAEGLPVLLPDQVWECLGEAGTKEAAEEQRLSVSAPCPRAKQLTAAFWMICFEQNTVIRENLRAAEQTTELGHSQPAALPGRAESPPANGCGPVHGGSSAPSPPIISCCVPLGLLHSSGKRGNLGGQTLLLFSHRERPMWGASLGRVCR